jgi:hypothetical protein
MVVTLGTDDRKHPNILRLPNAAPWITSSNFHRAQDTLSSRTGGKLGEFIGRSKAPKIKLCVFLGTSTRNWRPLCLCRWAWAAGGAFAGRQAQKKKCGSLTFACGGHTGSTKLFYQLALAGCHPATRMVLLANFWGRGVFGQVQTILLGECFFLLAQTPLKLMGILKSPYSTGLDILRATYFLLFSCPESLKHNRGSVCSHLRNSSILVIPGYKPRQLGGGLNPLEWHRNGSTN